MKSETHQEFFCKHYTSPWISFLNSNTHFFVFWIAIVRIANVFVQIGWWKIWWNWKHIWCFCVCAQYSGLTAPRFLSDSCRGFHQKNRLSETPKVGLKETPIFNTDQCNKYFFSAFLARIQVVRNSQSWIKKKRDSSHRSMRQIYLISS